MVEVIPKELDEEIAVHQASMRAKKLTELLPHVVCMKVHDKLESDTPFQLLLIFCYITELAGMKNMRTLLGREVEASARILLEASL